MIGSELVAALTDLSEEHANVYILPVIWADGQQVNEVTVEDGAIILRPGVKISKSTQPQRSPWHEAGCLALITGEPCLCQR